MEHNKSETGFGLSIVFSSRVNLSANAEVCRIPSHCVIIVEAGIGECLGVISIGQVSNKPLTCLSNK